MKLKLQCQSKTRQSNYTVQCNGVGIVCKNGNIRCKNHAGKSTGPRSASGKLRSLANLIKYNNDKRTRLNNRNRKSNRKPVDDWSTFVEDLQRPKNAKSV